MSFMLDLICELKNISVIKKLNNKLINQVENGKAENFDV